MSIGNRIKLRREQLGMSADELGRQLDKDRSTIYRYENGEIENMPLNIVEPIAKALHTTPQYLVGWDEYPKEKDMTIAEKIKKLRTEQNITLAELAKQLGVQEATVQRYESGVIKNLKHETILKLAEILGVTPAQLTGWDILTPANNALHLSINDEEQNLLQTYRQLDNFGKEVVIIVAEAELKRIKHSK